MKTWFMKRTTLIEFCPHGWHLTSTKLVLWMKKSSSMWLINSINSLIFIHINKISSIRSTLFVSLHCHVLSMSLMSTFVNFIHVLWLLISHVSSTLAMWLSSTMWSKSINVNNTIQVDKFIQMVFFFIHAINSILSRELHSCCCFTFIHVAIAFELMSILSISSFSMYVVTFITWWIPSCNQVHLHFMFHPCVQFHPFGPKKI